MTILQHLCYSIFRLPHSRDIYLIQSTVRATGVEILSVGVTDRYSDDVMPSDEGMIPVTMATKKTTSPKPKVQVNKHEGKQALS